MNLSECVSITSGLVFTVGYLDYNRSLLKGKSKPPVLTWIIWFIVGIVSARSYFLSTGSDAWKTIIPILNTILCLVTLVIACMIGVRGRFDRMDMAALGFGSIATLILCVYGEAEWANMVTQMAIICGFIPLWRGIRSGEATELSRPWYIWTCAYSLTAIVVIMRWRGKSIELVYPVLAVFLHLSIPWMMSKRKPAY